jgi:GT2 family glycosyltransferase
VSVSGRQVSVDVVIVNWNGGDEVLRAARSAFAFNATPIVVDNGSTDGSAARLGTEVPEATVIELGYNAGFSKACNVGAAAGDGEFVLLLNPDAELIGGTIHDLAEAFASDPRVAIVGAKTVDDNGNVVTSVRRFPTPLTLLLYQLKLHRFSPRIGPLRNYFMLDFAGDRASVVDQVIGAAFAMRRSDWNRFGGLDEGYFLLFEEVDLSRRVAEAGSISLYWPSLVVRHIGSTSFRKLSHTKIQRTWNSSLIRYARLHFGRTTAVLLACTVPLTVVVGVTRDLVATVRRGVIQIRSTRGV